MADALSDAEKIRQKRLAKLGAPLPQPPQQQSSSETQAEASPEVATALQTEVSAQEESQNKDFIKPKINISNARPSSTQQENPFSQLGLKDASPNVSSPATSSNNTQAFNPTKRQKQNEPLLGTETESLETWEDRTLGEIFRITLDENKKSDFMGQSFTYLGDLRSELEEQKEPLRMTVSLVEQAIIEAGSNRTKESPFDYLLSCWKRLARQQRTQKTKLDTARLDVLKDVRQLCTSYCILAATEPILFGQEPDSLNPLASHLLIDQEDERGLSHDFLMDVIARFEDDESARDIMISAVEELSTLLASLSMNGDFEPYVHVLRRLVEYPPMVTALSTSSRFLRADLSAERIETDTLLGPFFRISPLQEDVMANYFPGANTRDKGTIANAQNAVRMTLRTHQTILLDITNKLVQNRDTREKTLDWFAMSVNLNHKRKAMRVDRTKVSSDGFMINLTACLDGLCSNFMEPDFRKVDRIDIEYLRRSPRVTIQDETKINTDQNTADEFYSRRAEGTSNFISEIFFLTAAAHHYGRGAAASQLSQLEKDLKYMEKEIANLEAERPKLASNPILGARLEAALRKYKDEFERGVSRKYATQGILLDEQAEGQTMMFMRHATVWLLRLVSGSSSFPKSGLKLPLPETQAMAFRCLPEYFLEGAVDTFKFIMRYMPQILTSTQSDELIMMSITFLRNGEYVKNPYVKAGLVTILYAGSLPYYNRSKGVFGDLLMSHPFATNYLLHALMKFYNEAEHTGAHTAFYDKFNIRYEIFQIIKCIWSNSHYREQLSTEAKVNVDFFVQFVNLLLNDVTYVLDESLSAFAKIHELQELLNSGQEMEQQIRTEKEEALSEAQNKAKNYMLLTNESVAMLKLFTEALAESFTMPEIVQRLADMLDYNLEAMVGPKSSQLKVKNADEYNFRPRVLLAEIVDVYLNLQKKESFVQAVARDGRSYKPENFEAATTILSKWALKSPDELKSWRELGARVKTAKEIDDQAEEDLGEIPDEFLDPLMFTLMEDPVILPTSRTSIDRSTIRSHLLSDPNDPFNRSPLKIEDVVPDTELKAKIEAFKAERKALKLAETSEKMDTS